MMNDSDNLSESMSTAYGTVTVEADGSFVYVPATNFTGNDTFEVTISDGFATVTMTVTIHAT